MIANIGLTVVMVQCKPLKLRCAIDWCRQFIQKVIDLLTVRRQIRHVIDPERTVAVNYLLADDGEAVHIGFLCTLDRYLIHPQQFRGGP